MEKNLVLDGVPLSDEEIAFIRNKRKPILKLDSLSRPKKNESIRLCIDFGTAVSKAWATGERLTQTYPLLLGRFEELEPSNVFGVISSIYISKDGKVFFGKAAVNQHISDPTPNRSRFDNIKFMISHEVPSVDLDEIPLTEQIDPTGSGLTKGDLLSLYFGWLTSVSLRALRTQLPNERNLEATVRRFAIPCFQETTDEFTSSSARAEWATGAMIRSLRRGQILADTLDGEWGSLSASYARSLLRALREQDLENLKIIAKIPAVREPVAAGASRFDDEFGSANSNIQRQILVVDAGAGTTDFAVFQSKPGVDGDFSFALLSPSVRMNRVAGNAVDEVVWPLALAACGINPSNGSPRSPSDFERIKHSLAAQLRRIKEEVFAMGRSEISLQPNARGHLTIAEVESSLEYQSLGRRLMEDRNRIFEDIYSAVDVSELKRRVENFGKPLPIFVLLTGGSSKLPIIKNLSSGRSTIMGIPVEFKPLSQHPTWITRLPRELSGLMQEQYAQAAVAIGGSAPHLPHEMADMNGDCQEFRVRPGG